MSKTRAEALGIYIFTTVVVFVISAVLVLISGSSSTRWLLTVVLILTMAYGFFQQAEVLRVASRTDHVSSLWMLLANIFLFLAILFVPYNTALGVSFVYFGVPAIFQIAAAVHLVISLRSIERPRFKLKSLMAQLISSLDFLVYSVADYLKIFLSGILLGIASGEVDYAKYTTIVLVVARLVNPLSLITRPLLPAYIDARAAGDTQWIRSARTWCTLLLGGGGAAILILPILHNAGVLNLVLQREADAITLVEVISFSVFLCSHAGIALVSPFFFATRRMTRALAHTSLLAVTVSLLLGYCLALHFGAAGMLFATALGSLAIVLMASYYLYTEVLVC
ncbi:hypothetical protein KD146_07500 [Devosia sp. BSSL-BM10]|uniref:Uncharacterized protein n=1 Tax=Devosia litorisediminis TaxID=2829817 RepID=A0A942IDR0_9HYPH|nr:hypothetical protein [Devosia litorisediminis]MBS3848545.1 hypothetical protein [Devosia litorisediminis]